MTATAALNRVRETAPGIPGVTELRRRLARALDDPGIVVERRRANIEISTHGSELLRCRRGDGSSLNLFGKYSGPPSHAAHAAAAGHQPPRSISRAVRNPSGAYKTPLAIQSARASTPN